MCDSSPPQGKNSTGEGFDGCLCCETQRCQGFLQPQHETRDQNLYAVCMSQCFRIFQSISISLTFASPWTSCTICCKGIGSDGYLRNPRVASWPNLFHPLSTQWSVAFAYSYVLSLHWQSLMNQTLERYGEIRIENLLQLRKNGWQCLGFRAHPTSVARTEI